MSNPDMVPPPLSFILSFRCRWEAAKQHRKIPLTMKRCNHSHWLSICGQSGDPALVQSDRLAALMQDLAAPDIQQPSLFVLIGTAGKYAALQSLYHIKSARRLVMSPSYGEVHLHLDPATVSTSRPVMLASYDIRHRSARWAAAKRNRCHKEIRRSLHQLPAGAESTRNVFTSLLFPFAEVLCFFSDDLGGFKGTAKRLALWLDQSYSLTAPKATPPSVVIVTSRIPPRAAAEMQAKRAFITMLEEEMRVGTVSAGISTDSPERLPTISVVAIRPKSAMSADVRFKRAKERLMEQSQQVRKHREAGRMLYSATHISAFLTGAGAHFACSLSTPFNLIQASRIHNPVAPDLAEHLSRFLSQVTSSSQLLEFTAPMIASTLLLDSYPPSAHVFDYKDVFDALYRPALLEVSESRVIALANTGDIILRSGLVAVVETCLARCFEQLVGGKTAIEIHKDTLTRFQGQWQDFQSSSTCLCCLRRRPQYALSCGHYLCENCVVVFGERSSIDPWIFRVHHCFLCGKAPPSDVAIRVHPPTAGAGALCIDGGGTRGIVPLVLMKRIQDRIGLPIPLQRFVKVAFGVSIGAVIAIDHYINGRTLSESIKRFPNMMERSFQRRSSLDIPFLSRAYELTASYFADGLYPVEAIEAVLKEALGANKNILDYSYATATGTKVGLPVATVGRYPSYRIFTNYNGVGQRDRDTDKNIIKPDGRPGGVPLWEIARAVSAAPCFFPPKHIDKIGTFQDPGLLENDPLLWALSEISTHFPLSEEPDFVISLGTGEPGSGSYDVPTSDCRSVRGNGMLRRVCDLLLEKTRDKPIRRACKTAAMAGRVLHRIHRLNVSFDAAEPRLDDTSSIPELIAKVQHDPSLSLEIDVVARRMVASLFYFELDSLPQWYKGRHLVSGHILCSIPCGDAAFKALINKISYYGSRFLVNDCVVLDTQACSSLGQDGNFRLHVCVEAVDQFAITLELGCGEASGDIAGSSSNTAIKNNSNNSNNSNNNISGSPFSVQKLVAAQGLDAPFGRPDHGKRKAPSREECLPKKRRRLLT